MPVPGVQAPPAEADAGGADAIPFLVGTNAYREAPFSTVTQLLDANSHDVVVNITPGGYLRGVTMQVTNDGTGDLTSGTLAQDAPFSILSSCSLEDISGGSVLYPMSGFSHYVCQKYLRPWDGDPALRADFSASINPSFTLRFFTEVKDTLAVLANTDARAQYRFNYTLAPADGAAGPYGITSNDPATTNPTVTIKLYIESWAQPDLQDLMGNPIEQVPDGLVASRFLMHEQPELTKGNNVVRFTLVGNENRGFVIIIRDGDGPTSRIDLTDANTGAIDYRLDSRRLWKMTPSQLVEEMNAFYPMLGSGQWTRETGVYVIPRFAGPPDSGSAIAGQGEYWLQTVEQTLMQWEFNGADLTTAPGSMEIIYDALAIAGEVPAHLEGA